MDQSLLHPDPTAAAAAARNGVRLYCVAVREETPTIRTFVFKAQLPGTEAPPAPHEPGQSMTLALPIEGETLYRTFSLSAPPRADGLLEMTIKAHAGGRGTRWMHRAVAVGTTLSATRPHGRFTLAHRRPAHPVALVSAGSGATPLMAMLRHLATVEPEADVAWFHAGREAEEILFAAELARLQMTMPNLQVTIALSRPRPGWFGLRGRVTRRLMSVAIPDLSRRDVFCCGPAGFMDGVKLIHRAEGGSAGAFHCESFGGLVPAAGSPALLVGVADGPVQTASINGRRITVNRGETLLQGALRQGMVIPCGCTQGLCGTCRVRRIDGDTEMRHQGGISLEDEAAGYVLACSTRLLSDATFSLD